MILGICIKVRSMYKHNLWLERVLVRVKGSSGERRIRQNRQTIDRPEINNRQTIN